MKRPHVFFLTSLKLAGEPDGEFDEQQTATGRNSAITGTTGDLRGEGSQGLNETETVLSTIEMTETTSIAAIETLNNVTQVGNTSEKLVMQAGQTILKYVQVGVASVGCSLNFASLVILKKCSESLSPTMLLIMSVQAVLDGLACLCGFLLAAAPRFWKTGQWYVDAMFCYIWHSQVIYWAFVTFSTYNLLQIARDRLISICYPLQYSSFTTGKVRKGLLLMLIPTCFQIVTTMLMAEYDSSGQCKMKDSSEVCHIVCITFNVLYWFTLYGIPVVTLICIYTRVVLTLKQRAQLQLGSSAVITQASTELARTGIIVSSIFMLTMGWDVTYVLITHIEGGEIDLASLLVAVAGLLSALNCASNPIVYVITLPVFRRKITTLFCQH